MKKLLVALTGLVGITTSSVSTISTITTTNVGTQNITYNFAEQRYNEYISRTTPLKFSIDNINLTAMGIRGIDQLHNDYKDMFIPGLKITFLDYGYPQINGDTWYTDRREMGDEDWERGYEEKIDGKWCIVETASTLWFSGSGNFMMRLSYQIFCLEGVGSDGGNVSVQTGSTIEFRS